MNNNKGVVIMVVLWVFIVLALIAWGLSRRSSIEVSVAQTYQGKVISYAAARAGINYAIDLLQRTPSTKDTLYSPGVTFDTTKTPADIFSHIATGPHSYAQIIWPAVNYSLTGINLEYGLRDEDGKININAIGAANYQILSALLMLKGLSQRDADTLSMAVINYTGINAAAGASNNFSLDLNGPLLKPKGRHYENLLELLEVSGMTKDIFAKIKDDITVYGDDQTGLWVNTDTANNEVIQAITNAAVRLNPSLNAADLVSEAYTVRDGADGQSFTSDDGVASVANVNDPNWPQVLQEGISNYYRARVVGVDTLSGARTVLEAVIHRAQNDTEIISWQKD